LSKDGSEWPIEDSAAPILDTAGNLTGVVLVFHDVAERRRAQDALLKSETTLRGILNAAEESIWLFSPDGRILLSNATAIRRFGKPADTIIGKRFDEIMPTELAGARLARIREVVKSGQSVTFEDERSGIEFRHRFYPCWATTGA